MSEKRANGPIWIVWLALAFFAAQASYDGLAYIFGDSELFSSIFRVKYSRHIVLVRTHSVAGALALATSLLAFLPATRRFLFHRYLGRVYIGSVLVAGFTALPMAAMAAGTIVSKIGFFIQAMLWIATSSIALRFILKRQIRRHRRWMIRSFSVTYGAVVTRLLLNLLLTCGFSFYTVYDLVSWSWLVPVAAGEAWIYLSSPSRQN